MAAILTGIVPFSDLDVPNPTVADFANIGGLTEFTLYEKQ